MYLSMASINFSQRTFRPRTFLRHSSGNHAFFIPNKEKRMAKGESFASCECSITPRINHILLLSVKGKREVSPAVWWLTATYHFYEAQTQVERLWLDSSRQLIGYRYAMCYVVTFREIGKRFAIWHFVAFESLSKAVLRAFNHSLNFKLGW